MFFTYLLGWTNTGKFYYGVRYKDGIDPSSVGTTYFSSSKYVAEHIKEFGRPDIIQIRKLFETKVQAKRWEEKVIRRLNATRSPRWLNKGNNNSFKDVIMNSEVASSISKAKVSKRGTRPPLVFYNNGIENRAFRYIEDVPIGWIKGKLQSAKQLEWYSIMNDILTHEKRKEAGKKSSATLKGRAKPEGFGEKISRAQLGKAKPWNCGENNPAKSAESRKKISEKKKGCKHFTDGSRLIFVKPEDKPEGFWQTSVYEYKKLYENKQSV